ncbi:MAG: AraC family transcriptional regulator ligand-binding domain-containing protein [Gammaproteobacteria bacterium]|nr:AraC family transcriptional regulator ligand-binding domain-containing protein [Gammaproteobacteria bacterium]
MLNVDEPGAEEINEPVPLEFARALLVQARAYGRDIDALLETARFPFNPLLPPERPVFVSIEQYSRLCMALFQELGDESGGAISGIHTPIGTTRLLLYSVLRCGNLQAAMERAIEFNACCRERQGEVRLNDLVIDRRSKLATLRYYSTPDLKNPPPQEGTLCGLSMWVRLCGWLIGQYIDIVSATCAGPPPRPTHAIRHFFHCPVAFDCDCDSVTFSARHLELELLRSEQDLESFLRVAPYHVVIKPITSDASITTRIRALLGSDLRGALPSFEALTSLLNMSARTLRRRLEKEGTSYQRIKDNARRDAAISLLSRDRMTVSDVAEQVGFSDPSAFHRSFKKWTGQSPGAYG